MPHDKKGRVVEVGDQVKFEVTEYDGAGEVLAADDEYAPPVATQAGFGRIGAMMATALLALAACVAVPAFAADTATSPCGTKDKPEPCVSVTTGVAPVITRHERREYVTLGVSLEAPLPLGLAGFFHADTLGLQDGGSLGFGNPQSFRAIKLDGGIGKGAGAFLFNLRGGITYSIEGQVGAPVDPRMFEALAEVALRLADGGHVSLRGGHDGTVGGWSAGADVEIPVAGGPAIVARYDFPFQRGATGRLPYVITAGMRVKVKSFHLSLPKS